MPKKGKYAYLEVNFLPTLSRGTEIFLTWSKANISTVEDCLSRSLNMGRIQIIKLF
jgi:hypothetical protein